MVIYWRIRDKSTINNRQSPRNQRSKIVKSSIDKEHIMRGLVLFIAGLAVGAAVQTGVAQGDKPGVVGLNHVGIAVPDIPAAAAYYTEKMGFKEAFRNSNPQGQPTSIYMQISRDTFLELQQVNAQRPAGVTHFGLVVENMKTAVAAFRARGATVADPGPPSGFSKAILSNVTDLNGLRIELAELTPDSLQRKAAESWK
jgi:catechol 2,3-dioxygenase-like lactoylglutathione lyase family enzyme